MLVTTFMTDGLSWYYTYLVAEESGACVWDPYCVTMQVFWVITKSSSLNECRLLLFSMKYLDRRFSTILGRYIHKM